MTLAEDRPTEAEQTGSKPDLFDRIRDTPVGRTIWRSPRRVTPRDRAAAHWSSFAMHIYPVKMKREQIAFKYSWYLGVISTVLFGSLVISGVYLMFFYVPSPDQAYADMQTIQNEITFGQYLRNVHRWSAHLMVLAVVAHMCKMFYRGAYKPPREGNWIIGVGLLATTLLMSFTGYLLPWDQLAFWAVTVGTEMAAFVPFVGDSVREVMLGGPVVGASTLLRFYVLHVAVLPLMIVFLLTFHLWRWRKDSMLETARSEPDV
ncbi:MAG: DUF4405 domain-containing protein [Actinomycetia bacterium]|nr:DUF4405 domain-containing protein [Actinomycetes bacterium]MCP4962181.1 DUF4405 domain-containing protein [Actinomycetes bacterium]